MKKYAIKAKSLLKRLFRRSNSDYDFDESNPLGDGGERVDFIYNPSLKFESLDMYQQNHFKRYEFAAMRIRQGEVCGDFACGTGYGSIMLAEKSSRVVGIDLNEKVVSAIKVRYASYTTVTFASLNLLDLNFNLEFDTIVSFETLEHFNESQIIQMLGLFNRALRHGGRIIFSTPFMQEDSEVARKLGFHKTFYIDEHRIKKWLEATGFKPLEFFYQNYDTHEVVPNLQKRDCIICIAEKKP